MYVSMTPHGESGKVLHCSQNDGSERKWEIKLYDQQGVIDGTEGQTVFPVTVGGTEEVISEGLSTPIIADIEYPDETRNDQIFKERTSPTTEDGNAEIKRLQGSSLIFNQKAWQEENATITSIKGNTVKFNQLIKNGNFTSTSDWVVYDSSKASISVSNNIMTVSYLVSDSSYRVGIYQIVNAYIPNHKYCIFLDVNSTKTGQYAIDTNGSKNGKEFTISNANTWESKDIIFTAIQSDAVRFYIEPVVTVTSSDSLKLKNVMLLDLTAIGIDNFATATEVEEWLSTHIGLLPYYGYTPGMLIPFMGTGLKTTGKNFLQPFSSFNRNGLKGTVNNGEIILEGKASSSFSIVSRVYLKKGTYNISGCYRVNGFYTGGLAVSNRFYIRNGNTNIFDNRTGGNQFIINDDNEYEASIVFSGAADYTFNGEIIKPMIRYDNTDDSFEPYQENILSLPTLTYFPTGMKDARTAYDEISDKAYTRVGSYTFTGQENFFKDGSARFATGVDSYIPIKIYNADSESNLSKAVCNNYEVTTQAQIVSGATKKIAFGKYGTTTFIYFSVDGMTDTSELKTWLQNNPTTVYFELATPTEQDISLDLTYPIWNGGTEQILPVNSSTPTTSAFKGVIEYPDGTEETEFLYKQTKSGVLINGHSYITRINNVWSNVQGTGQTISYGQDDMIIDLTQMSSSYITNYSQFIEYFDGDYEYNKGQLVSFTGERINGVALPQFANGMKSVNTTYDEFTETSKTVRIGMRAYQSGDENNSNVLTDMTNTLYILDDPVITYFKTASLICKGIEMPINNGVVECDTRVSEEAGMFPAKVKLSDGTGVAYSEKLSIYVERKP